MKQFSNAALVVLMAILVGGCSMRDKMKAEEYMDMNISMWNGAALEADPWISGDRAEEFSKALQTRKNLKNFVSRLGKPHKELSGYLTLVGQYPIPEDARELNNLLIAYLQGTIECFSVMKQIAALPDGFTDAQLEPLGQELSRITAEIDTRQGALDAAQKAYAKKYRIHLQEVGG